MASWHEDPDQIERLWAKARAAGISRRQFLYSVAALAGSLAGGAALGACAPATQAPAAATQAPAAATKAPTAAAPSGPSGTVTLAYPRAVSALDARRHRTTEEQVIFFHLYDPLCENDDKMVLRPRIAESWEWVDLNTWRFKIRQGVKFHNGETLTADNVKFTVDQYANLNPVYNYITVWGPAWPPSATVESPTSVLIKTAKPCPILPRLLTRFGILPMKAALETTYPDAPVASGPYKFAEWKKGDRVVLDANPDYWGGAPKIKQLVFRTVADAGARAAALEAGEITLCFNLPVERVDKLPSTLTTIQGKSNNKGELLFTFRNPKSPVAQLKVRQALIRGLDEKQIIDNILTSRGATRLLGPAPSSSSGSVDAGGYPARDVAGAKKLLAEAGFATGLKMSMIYTPGEFAKDLEVAEAIQGQLAEIGVDFKIDELEQGAYSTRRSGTDWDVAPNGTGGWSGDAEFFIGNTKNNNGYESAAVNALLDQGNGQMDLNKRISLLQEAQKLMWADIPWLWAFEVVWVHGVSKKLTGWEMNPNGQILLMRATLAA